MKESPSNRCAYCDVQGPLTREHILPVALDKEFRPADADMDEPYWLDRLEKKMIGGQPTVKDVCQICNNQTLSRLDAYALNLYREYFSKITEKGSVIDFRHDFDSLVRWLLKVSFNSARANRAFDLESFAPLRAYMIGRKKRPKHIAVYLTLLFPESIRDEIKLKYEQKGITLAPRDEPDILRIGHFKVPSEQWTPQISRHVTLKSYMFNIFWIRDKASIGEFQRLKQLFESVWGDAVLLNPHHQKICAKAMTPNKETFQTHVHKNLGFYKQRYPKLFEP